MEKDKRLIGIDLVKIIAAAMVIAVHHLKAIDFYKVIYEDKTMIVATSIHVIALACVPLFLVTTGYLLSNRDISKSHYLRLFNFLLEVCLIFAISVVIKLILNGSISLESWLAGMKNLMKTPPYYIGLYISTYMMAPFYNKMFKTLTDKQKHILVLTLIFTISIPNVLNKIIGSSLFDTRPTHVWATMYYVLGVYFKYFQPKIKRIYTISFMALLSISYSLVLSVLLKGTKFSYIFGYYENIFTALITASIFLTVYNINFKNNTLRVVINFLSASTMSFYLGSGVYSDFWAMKYITLNGNLLKDLQTIPFKIVISMLFSIPLAMVVYITLKYINTNKKQRT